MDKIVLDQATYSVGYPEMDRQHIKMIELINRSIELEEEGGSEEQLKDLLAEMVDYAWYHFEAEEALLTELGIEGLQEHIQAHDAYSKRVVELSIIEGLDNQLKNINEFLSQWWLSHILIEDMKYKKE